MSDEPDSRDRTKDINPDDMIRYANIEIQCKDKGWPRPLTGTKSHEIIINAGVVKIKKFAADDAKYTAAELFLDDEPEQAAGTNEQEPTIEGETPCWHQAQGTCPWKSTPFEGRPFKDDRSKKQAQKEETQE